MYNEWESYLQYSITNYPGEGYVCSFSVSWLPGMRNNFADLRFSDGSGLKLSYWVESYTASRSAVVRVRLGKSNIVYLHYGNPSAASESDGSKVFDLFDDFKGSVIDTNVWTTEVGGTYILGVSNSILTSYATSGYTRVNKKTAFTSSITVEHYSKFNDNNGSLQRNRFGHPTGGTIDVGVFGTTLYFAGNVGTITIGTYYKFTHKWVPGTSYNMQVAGIGSWTATNDIASSYSPGIWAGDGSGSCMYGDSSTDWFAVRKYVATEPTPVLIAGGVHPETRLLLSPALITPNLFELPIPDIQVSTTRTLIKPGSDTNIHENGPVSKTDKYRDWPDVIRYRIDNFPGATYICVFAIKWLPGMRADFSDIRFSDGRGSTLSYFLNSYTSASSAEVLVKLGTSSTVYLHYGNPSAKSESTSSILTYFDDFSTDTSANYTVQNSNTNSKTAKAYDALNKCLKQTNTGAAQHWIVCTTDNNTHDVFTFEAKYRLSNDTVSRNHAGAIIEWSTAAISGYRVTHLDGVFVNSHYENNTEITWTSNSTADTNIYADDRWITYRVHRNRLTGITRITYTYGSYSTSQLFYPVYNKLYTSGHIGIHSYGCETAIKDIRIWKSAATEPVPVMVGSNRAFDPIKISGEFTGISTHYDRETGVFLSISQTGAERHLHYTREAASNVTKSDTDAERTLKSKRDTGVFSTKVDTSATSGSALHTETGVFVTDINTQADRELKSKRDTGTFVHPQVKVEAAAAHARATGVFVTDISTSGSGETVFKRDAGSKVTKIDTALSGSPKLQRTSGVYLNDIQNLLAVYEPYHRALITLSRSVRYRDFTHFREYYIQNFPGKDCLCAITIPWLPGMKSDFSDIRFTDNLDNKLSYYLESYTAFSTAKVQVKLGSTPVVNLYYGNGSAKSESTTSVYAYFDDFSTDTTSRYATANENSSYPTVISYDSVNKQLKQTATDAHAHMIYCTVDSLPTTYIYEAKVYVATDTQTRNHAGVLFEYSSTTAYHFYRLATLDSTVACSRWDSSSSESTMATGVSNTSVYADARWLTYRILRNRTTGATTCKIIYGSNSTTQTFTNTTYTTGHIGLFSWGNETWFKDVKVWKGTSLTEPVAVLRTSGTTQRLFEANVIPGTQYLKTTGVKVSPVQTQGTYTIGYKHETGVFVDIINTDASRILRLPREAKVFTLIQTLAAYKTGGFSRASGSFLDPHVKAERALDYDRVSGIYLNKSFSLAGHKTLYFRLGNYVYIPEISNATTKISENHSFFGHSIPDISVSSTRERNKYTRNSGVYSNVSEKVVTEGDFHRDTGAEIPVINLLIEGNYGQNREAGLLVPDIQTYVDRVIHLKSTSGLDIQNLFTNTLITGVYYREALENLLLLSSKASTSGSFNRASGSDVTPVNTLAGKYGENDRLSELFLKKLQISSHQLASLKREVKMSIPAPSVLLFGAVNFDHPHHPFVVDVEAPPFTVTVSSPEYGISVSKNLQYVIIRDGETMIEITQYDTDTFSVALKDTDPTTGELRSMPLTGKTVKAILKGGTPTTTVTVDCDIVSDGLAQFKLTSENTAVPGNYLLKLVILGTGFRKELPEVKDDFLTITINDATYTTF